MASLRSLGVALALLAILVVSGPNASAAPVTYNFSGVCDSGSSPGDCGFFDLSDGDPVTGSLTLDRDLLSSNSFTTFLPTDPTLDFTFQFGNVSFDKSDLDPLLNIRVMLSDPAGTGIILQNAVHACINAVFPCAVGTDGTVQLSIGSVFGSIDRNTEDGTINQAFTLGSWTLAPAPPIPEPSVPVLSGLAVAALAVRRRRR